MQAFTYMHNGKIVDNDTLVSIKDVGVLRGYGLFDYFKVIRGVPVFVEDHLDRLFKSCKGLHLDIPFSRHEVLEMIHGIIRAHPIDTFAIRIVVTGGIGADSSTAGTPQVYCIGEPIILPSMEAKHIGTRLTMMEYTRYLWQYKSINYISLMANKPLLAAANADDFLYTHHGYVSESTRSNVFFVKDDKTIVTSDEYILEGVTRLRLLDRIKNLGLNCEVRPVKIEELASFKEAFITGSSKNIMPIRSIDDHNFEVIGPVTQQLLEDFDDLSNAYIAKYWMV